MSWYLKKAKFLTVTFGFASLYVVWFFAFFLVVVGPFQLIYHLFGDPGDTITVILVLGGLAAWLYGAYYIHWPLRKRYNAAMDQEAAKIITEIHSYMMAADHASLRKAHALLGRINKGPGSEHFNNARQAIEDGGLEHAKDEIALGVRRLNWSVNNGVTLPERA